MWWQALGLALSFYGAVVLMEWLYDHVVRRRASMPAPLSVVVRAANQESKIEQVVRDVVRLVGQSRWLRADFEILVAAFGSRDRTSDIAERFTHQYPSLRLIEPDLRDDQIIAQCRYPVIIWLDLSRAESQPILDRLGGILRGLGS